jgi:hypothetical protein
MASMTIQPLANVLPDCGALIASFRREGRAHFPFAL